MPIFLMPAAFICWYTAATASKSLWAVLKTQGSTGVVILIPAAQLINGTLARLVKLTTARVVGVVEGPIMAMTLSLWINLFTAETALAGSPSES